MASALTSLFQVIPDVLSGKLKGFDLRSPRLGTAGVQQIGPPGEGFAVLRTLTPDEYAQFKEAGRQLGRFGAARQVIRIARRNAEEFEQVLTAAGAEYAADTAMTWQRVNELVIRLNQRLLNFLSAMRTYLDHAEARLMWQL